MNPTRAELAEVVEAAQAGDNRAWAELIARFQDAAVAMAVAYSGDWEGAPDVAQEAFGLAYRNFADLQDPRAFPGWFSTLIRTASARRTRRRQLALVPLDGVEIADSDKDPASVVTDDEDSVRLRAAVELLPEPERAVVALHYLGDLPYRDVAAFLGIGLSAAKKRAFTARRRLKETLPMVTEALRAARPSRGERFREHDPALRRDPRPRHRDGAHARECGPVARAGHRGLVGRRSARGRPPVRVRRSRVSADPRCADG